LNQQAARLAMQFGLDHQHDYMAGALAHGEKRQLEVAMTLAGNPSLLLLDEPMAGIGPGGSKKLTELLDELRGHYTVLLVEHDMDAVFALADRISVLVYGEIIATGSVDEIRRDEAVQRAYLGETC
jgi:branched-chain amino acid transport system ATP-binding protein